MIASAKLKGIEQAIAAFRRPNGHVYTEADRKSEETLRAIAQEVYQLSQVYVPVDTGYLRDHSGVFDEGGQGLETHLAIRYDTWYAIYVHEIVWYAHEPPTRAKFLEQAAREVKARKKFRYLTGPVRATAVED
jgi:hypothetical protein